MPTLVAAQLVAGHVDLLWSQWANDIEQAGCCTSCCAPCAALYELKCLGLLDGLYKAYLDSAGGDLSAAWDYDKDQVNRVWLLQAWGWGQVNCNCRKR